MKVWHVWHILDNGTRVGPQFLYEAGARACMKEMRAADKAEGSEGHDYTLFQAESIPGVVTVYRGNRGPHLSESQRADLGPDFFLVGLEQFLESAVATPEIQDWSPEFDCRSAAIGFQTAFSFFWGEDLTEFTVRAGELVDWYQRKLQEKGGVE